MKQHDDHSYHHASGEAAYQYLKNMLDNIADPIFVKDRAHRWIDGNKAFWDLMGGPPENFLGRTDRDFFSEAEAAVFWETDDKVFATGEQVVSEEFLTDRLGKTHIISTKKTLFFNEKGTQVLVGIIRDMTSEKELEALQSRLSQSALSQREQQYRNIFESTNDAILIFDMDGILREANPAASKIYGYSYEEFIGMHGADFSPPYARDRFVQFKELALAGERYFTESTHITKHREIIAIEVNGVSFDYRGAPHLLAVVRDITERKHATQELALLSERTKQQWRMYNTALSNTADFNYVFDLRGRFIYMNKAMLGVLEKPFEEVAGRNFAELGYPGPMAEQLQQQVSNVIETLKPVKGETRYTVSDTRLYEYIFQPVLREDGTLEAVAGSSRDITELKEADKRKDEFLAMLAHELRNPLAPISNAAHVLQSATVGAEVRHQAAALVQRQVNQMTHLLNDLLDVSRLTLGKIELRLETVSLLDVLSRAVENTRPFMDELKHVLSLDIPDEPIWLKADVTRLTQVFSNLLHNAAKYTEKGGHISIHAKLENASVMVTIKDDGIGIAPDMQPRIFELFAQADSSMERAQGGLGIGLTLVRSLVEKHGGTVSARSDGPSMGSEFSVRLAVEPPPAQNAMPKMIGAPKPAPPMRILVVDDNIASAKTLGWTLEMLGHQIQLAHDGEGALKKAVSFLPQAILLDIGLPGMNGYDVCRELRAHPALGSTVIIAQTGWGQKEHRQRSKEAGFAYHLVKPVDIEQLQIILTNGLEQDAVTK